MGVKLRCEESLQVGGLLSIIFILISFSFIFLRCSLAAGRGRGAFESCTVTEGVVPERRSLFGLLESFVFHFIFAISLVIINKQNLSLLF